MTATDPRLAAVIAAQPYPLLFVTISGAHLYGFPSADSDYDLRGVHVLPARAVLGLEVPEETQLVTRHHAHHYLGFAAAQWRLFLQEDPPRVKPLLYVFRVLLTGIHLMRTGEIEANLVTLNAAFRLPYIPALVARKLAGAKHGVLETAEVEEYAREVARLRAELEHARDTSPLPDRPAGRAALNDLLVQLRLPAE